MSVLGFELFFLESRHLRKEKWQCRKNLNLNPTHVNIKNGKLDCPTDECNFHCCGHFYRNFLLTLFVESCILSTFPKAFWLGPTISWGFKKGPKSTFYWCPNTEKRMDPTEYVWIIDNLDSGNDLSAVCGYRSLIRWRSHIKVKVTSRWK